MPFYKSQGTIPRKRHTVFSKNNNTGIYYEEHISREGFSNIYSNTYHIHMPTQLKKISSMVPIINDVDTTDYRHRHLETSKLENTGDICSARTPLFYNDDVVISIAHITQKADFFYKNAHHDELLYFQSGSAIFKSNFGSINIKKGDYLIIPRGVIWNISDFDKVKCLIVESKGMIRTPKRYRNRFGQLLEHSPFCERDIHTPKFEEPIDQQGDFQINVKYSEGIQSYIYSNHPFDVVGWDGYYFPYTLNIADFEPVTGSIHQPPPVHQTFEGDGFVICSFVERPFDYHPNAIPAPYPHSNVDSDELIFYSKGNFMSRSGIKEESITYHPMGLPHGPQPGKYESSIGMKKTDELAVMVDTFKTLKPTQNLLDYEDKDYYKSWIK